MIQWWGGCLLALDGVVYVSHEKQSRTETYCSQHKEESVADARHVAKEERGLHEAGHVGSGVIVVEAIGIDK